MLRKYYLLDLNYYMPVGGIVLIRSLFYHFRGFAQFRSYLCPQTPIFTLTYIAHVHIPSV